MRTHDLMFQAFGDGVQLGSTVTMPDSSPLVAGCVLVSGSGPQDRDESICGHRPLRVLAEQLAVRGVASIRFDDRGVGSSEGDYQAASAVALSGDVASAFATLRNQLPAEIPIGIVGHSQGGWVGPIAIVEHDTEADFVILLGAAGRPGMEMLLGQHRAMWEADGAIEATIASVIEFYKRLFVRLREAELRTGLAWGKRDADEASQRVLDELRRDLRGLLAEAEGVSLQPGQPEPEWLTPLVEDAMEWESRFIVTYDPAETLRRLSCPVLAITGSLDTQAPAHLELPAIRGALELGACPMFSVHEASGLNHLFQRCNTGSPDEYESIGHVMDPRVAEQIVRWLEAITRAA